MQWFGRPSVFNRRGKLTMVSDGEAGTRTNILAASVEDEQRRRDRSPAPVVGWRFRNGGWLRWSELDGDYVQRPVPASLVRYGESIGGPPEEHVVAMVEGEWREVSDGAAPLRGDPPVEASGPPGSGGASRDDGTAPHVTQSADRAPSRPGTGHDPTASPSTAPHLPDPSEPPAPPGPSVEEQLATWRARNRERG